MVKDLKMFVLNALLSHVGKSITHEDSLCKDSFSQECLNIAACLSSGDQKLSSFNIPNTQLISLFDRIELRKHKSSDKLFCPIVCLDGSSERIFPVSEKSSEPHTKYKELLDTLSDRIKKLADHRFYVDSIISLLEKYTWCIPFSETQPDVSIFDHAKSTAAIAQALFLYHKEKNTVPQWEDTEKKFILMTGDLSGIQNYIFGISKNSGPGVSKIFRARSFFLQVIVKSVLIEIERRLDLFSVCRLLETGGKFVLLLPNLDSVKEKLKALDTELQNWFLEKFKGVLTLNLCWDVELEHDDFLQNNFQAKMDEVNESLEKVKYRKLKRVFPKIPVLDQGYNEFEDGNCKFCTVNAADEDSKKRYEADKGVVTDICKDCYDQIDYIGRKLPNTTYLIYGQNKRIKLFGNISLTLSEKEPSEFENVFLVESLEDTGKFSRVRMAKHLPRLEKYELETDSLWRKLFESKEEDGKKPRLEEGDTKTFTQIACKSKKIQKNEIQSLIGRELLGFFKADVDNLGFIFSLGLKDRMSASRISSLSRMLNLFFSEYLVALAEKEFPDIYVVFAGGDDLFVVGPWHKTIEFAIKLREKLSLFCAGNKDITMSAGILITKPKFPMRKASELVEEHLEQAKKSPNKDSVGILGDVLSWANLKKLIALGKEFDTAVMEKQRTYFSTAFLYRLLTYHKRYRDFTNPERANLRSGLYLSLAHYDIGRNIRKQGRDNQKELNKLYDIFAVGQKMKAELEHLNIPLFYAINLNRE